MYNTEEPSGAQLDRLVKLVSKHFSPNDLNSHVRIILEDDLDAIAIEPTKTDIVFRLLDKLWRSGRLIRFLNGLKEKNPNPVLIAGLDSIVGEILARSIPNVSAMDSDLADELAGFAIGPPIRPQDIPLEIITMYANSYATLAEAERFLRAAMSIRQAVNPEGLSDDQILVQSGEIPPNPSSRIEFWEEVFSLAGDKSRRTVAALLVAPDAPDPKNWTGEMTILFNEFRDFVKNPDLQVYF